MASTSFFKNEIKMANYSLKEGRVFKDGKEVAKEVEGGLEFPDGVHANTQKAVKDWYENKSKKGVRVRMLRSVFDRNTFNIGREFEIDAEKARVWASEGVVKIL